MANCVLGRKVTQRTAEKTGNARRKQTREMLSDDESDDPDWDVEAAFEAELAALERPSASAMPARRAPSPAS